jgi:hypothetical protein
MKVKGFGKNYFSLSAICATTNSITLHTSASRYTHRSRNLSMYATTEEEDDPLDELELLQHEEGLSPSSSCHCNCFFKRLFYTLTQIFRHHPQTYFIFHKRHTGIAPPLITPPSYYLNF